MSDGTFEDIKEEDRESDYASLSDSDSDSEMEAPPQEDLPESPVYDQYLRRELDEVRRELDELATVIRDWNVAHGPYSTLTRLLKETEEFRDFNIQAHRIVGFIGDSGVGMLSYVNVHILLGQFLTDTGKSSIVNSLLDQKNIARSVGLF